MTRLRIIPWALGVALVAASVIGAGQLASPGSGGTAPAADGKGKPTGPGDLVQPGTVDSDPRPDAYLLPGHLPSATVTKVEVQNGQDVKAGDVLVRFDTKFAELDLKQAEEAVKAADAKRRTAEAARAAQAEQVNLARDAVATAESRVPYAVRAVDAAQRAAEREADFQKTAGGTLTPSEIERRKREHPEVIKAEADLNAAQRDITRAKGAQAAAEAQQTALAAQVEEAAQGVAGAATHVERAKLAINRSELRAEVAGTVERVDAHVGTVVSAQSRSPLLYVIPTGGRVVRVEVAPEYAHRIRDQVGQAVTITDDTNISLEWKGTVERVPSAFLPKRNGGADLLAAKQTVVLEVIVRVTDPTPPGKPPLRVGHPVRVTFQ